MTATSVDLYKAIKDIIFRTKPCPDGGGHSACPSCLAAAITAELESPVSTPIVEAAGRIPLFSAKDVQELMNAAVKLDRQECSHKDCSRASTGFVLVPL